MNFSSWALCLPLAATLSIPLSNPSGTITRSTLSPLSCLGHDFLLQQWKLTDIQRDSCEDKGRRQEGKDDERNERATVVGAVHCMELLKEAIFFFT